MRAMLVKRQDRYDLYGADGSKIASSAKNPFGKLSKQNCDEIFGVIDVEKLADEHCDRLYHEGNINWEKYRIHFKEGFSKAMELNKDKVFTAEDMGKLHNMIMCNIVIRPERSVYDPVPTEKYIQSLQQPTEIAVEIVTRTLCRQIDCVDDARLIESKIVWSKEDPMLDKDGFLILKKKL
jgi:hypothetical protein